MVSACVSRASYGINQTKNPRYDSVGGSKPPASAAQTAGPTLGQVYDGGCNE